MATGIVKQLRGNKGFGIIKRDRGNQGSSTLIFDQAAIPNGDFSKLWEGQRVSFEETRDIRVSSQLRAINVRPVLDGDK